jgi:predicted Zn-dependent protease
MTQRWRRRSERLSLILTAPKAMAALSLLKPAFGDYAEKLTLVNEALKRTPNDASLHVARSAWLYGVGRLGEAAAALETASRLDPLGPAVEGLRASLMTARGEVDTALEIMHAAWAALAGFAVHLVFDVEHAVRGWPSG